MKEVKFTYSEAIDLMKISVSEIDNLEETIKSLVDKRNKWIGIRDKMKSFVDDVKSTDEEFMTWLNGEQNDERNKRLPLRETM